MNDSHISERPSPSEKLAYKFILDSVNESQDEIAQPEVIALESNPIETGVITTEITEEKNYFRIGEVAELLRVEPHVLRYWETEFRILKPTKSRSGHRLYNRRDIQNLQEIRELLHIQKFSIKGAKAKLKENRKEQSTAKKDLSKTKRLEFLKSVSQDLRELANRAKTNPGV